ncbi:MAG: (d)CMP kinase [Candidatus Babeliaceae bacterium]|jgi:cytidylate kinase
MHIIITIDGPAASGKSSVARVLAQQLNAYYLYTGLLYRGLAYLLHTQYGYTAKTIHTLTDENVNTLLHDFAYTYDSNNGARIVFKNTVLDGILKSSTIDQLTSLASQSPIIRDALSTYQKQLVLDKKISVVEGRDSGTVVFDKADYKFFITADAEVRAARWQKDQQQHNNNFTFAEALAALTQRDLRDSTRAYAPLQPASDSIIVDTTHLTIEQTLAKICNTISHRNA